MRRERQREGLFRTSDDPVLRVLSESAVALVVSHEEQLSLQRLCLRFERSDSPLRSLCYIVQPRVFRQERLNAGAGDGVSVATRSRRVGLVINENDTTSDGVERPRENGW